MLANPFADVPPTPAGHFKLYFYAAVAHLIEQVSQSCGSHQATFEQFPFLAGYYDELVGRGLEELSGDAAAGWWCNSLQAWEETVSTHLPLWALREATGLGHSALTLLFGIGMLEEDARFGLLFEKMQGVLGQHRPTVGLLNAWWQSSTDLGEVRANLRRLQDLGLVQVINPDTPRIEWALQSPGLLWDALRGEVHEALASWACYHPPTQLVALDELLIPDTLQQRLALVPPLLSSGEAQTMIVRGPQHNGRRTLLGAVARALGRGMLEITGLSRTDDERWRLV